MEELSKLSAHHCVLLAAQYATESNIGALRTLTALREDDLEFGLILRLILTFLPETLEPSRYVPYLNELATDSRTNEQTTLDLEPIRQLSNSQAAKRVRKLRVQLQPLEHALYESESELEPFSHFLIHRSHRIDAETGLLELVPQLVSPFLHHSDYLRTWFISTVLPLLRLGYEYYPQKTAPSLENFAQWKGKRAIETLLSNLRWKADRGPDMREPTRDLRGIVGPWICGENDRKRRKLDVEDRRTSIVSHVEESDDWECLFEWLAQTSKDDFALTSSAFSGWDGPTDLDLGGYDEGQMYLDDDRQGQLERRYAQSALASLYMVHNSSVETIQTAYALLDRLSNLLSLESPPELNTSVESLPKHTTGCPISEETPTSILREENLLRPKNIITQPEEGAVRLLELFIFSAYLLANLQHPVSVRDVARMYVRNDSMEQTQLLQKIIHAITTGSKKDAEQWKTIRSILLWLWNWNSTSKEGDRHGQGVFGKIENKALETEILKALLESNHYPLVVQTYVKSPHHPLSFDEIEKTVLGTALQHYDSASNGNRTRGGMKKASDIISSFRGYFPSSSRFQRAEALLAATHAMSFYSLILQHGVPFQPVNIRVSPDPLTLLRKLISQNRNSYTHLDDLIHIGQNLVVSMPSTLMDDISDEDQMDPGAMEKKRETAERRVISMAIEAALENDDFETAYSYVVNRLSPPPASQTPAVSPALSTAFQKFYFGSYGDKEEEDIDDVSWRAALQAGRYASSSMSSSGAWSGSAARPDLRRLEQRMELLSQALLLAPPTHLEEVLAVWQECEEELTTLLAEEEEAEQKFNYMADRRLPGAFHSESVPTVQPRREVGRGAVEEAPMGLFDVARGAAAAFSKTAFPLGAPNLSVARGQKPDAATAQNRVSLDMSSDSGSTHTAEERVRRRDMLANTVTGGLASGLGWVLGANPVQDNSRQ